MKQILYKCDLCGIEEQHADDGGIIGISNYQYEYQIKDLDDTNKHLCVNCLKKVTDLGINFFKNVRPDYVINKS